MRVDFGCWVAVAAVAALCAAGSVMAGDLGDFDAAPWGTPHVANPGGSPVYAPQIVDSRAGTAVWIPAGGAAQIEWRLPRDIHAVRMVFDGDAPKAGQFRLQWWHHIWPDNGAGGWMKLDDPFNGRFVDAVVDIDDARPRDLQLWIKPLQTDECPGIRQAGADFRRTYKIRAVFDVPVRLAEIECFTDSNWKPIRLKIEMLKRKWDGKLEARNAEIISVKPQGTSAAVVDLRYADNGDRLSPDRGHVIVRRSGKGRDFSFFVDDVVRDGAIYVRDIEAFVCTEASTQSYNTWAGPEGTWQTTVAERVAQVPEQTFERAMREIPRMWIDDVHLGLPVLRQEASADAFSQVFLHKMSLRGIGSDTDRAHGFPEKTSEFVYKVSFNKSSIGGPSVKGTKRSLEDGYLPIVHSRWQSEGIDYHQVLFVAALDPNVTRKSLELPKPPAGAIGKGDKAADFGQGLRGDEPIALMNKLVIGNPAKTAQTAYVWLKPTPMSPLTLRDDGLMVLDQPTKPSLGADYTPVWGQMVTGGRGEVGYIKSFVPEGGQPKDARDLIRYTIELAPGEKHTIYLKIPYVEQMTQAEIAQLKALDWEKTYPEIKSLWNKRLAKAMYNYHAPEPVANNLYRTNLWHVLIGTDRDPSTGLWQHGAGTYDYPMYANEAMMVARTLNMRGEHEEARRLIEPYLVSQGARGLPGNFKTKDGLLYAAAPPQYDHYTAQGYNMHHGFILWTAAEHYLWTRDRGYLEAVAPNLIAACDWITRERQATKVMNPDGTRPIEFGLAPAGDLEDVEEYLYFYATNAYYYLGMKTTADALAAIGHPQAARIAADAGAYRDDIVTSVRESIATSPVVKLMDGSYVPFVPHRAYALTDQKEGWIREALYCSLHLETTGVIRPDDPEAGWILDDLEDRIYMSDVSGEPPEKNKMTLEDYWFSLSGYNPQPNLLDSPTAYLRRGQIPNFVRAFFNVFSASLHPDTVCFAEGCPPYASGGCCIYKTPDESKFVQWMRQMLVLEMGDELWIGRGVPREWMRNGKYVELKDAPSYFGPTSMKVASETSRGRIVATVALPTRNPPKVAHICFRHPDGRKVKSVAVNGKPWKQFTADGIVTLPGKTGRAVVAARY